MSAILKFNSKRKKNYLKIISLTTIIVGAQREKDTPQKVSS